MAEAAETSLGFVEHVDFLPFRLFDALNDQLGDPVAALDLVGLSGIGIEQQHSQFIPITTVDQAGRIDAGDSVSQRKPAARLNETGIAGRNCYCDAGRNHGPTPTRIECGGFCRQQVAPGIARSCICRHGEGWVEATYRHNHHGENCR